MNWTCTQSYLGNLQRIQSLDKFWRLMLAFIGLVNSQFCHWLYSVKSKMWIKKSFTFHPLHLTKCFQVKKGTVECQKVLINFYMSARYPMPCCTLRTAHCLSTLLPFILIFFYFESQSWDSTFKTLFQIIRRRKTGFPSIKSQMNLVFSTIFYLQKKVFWTFGNMEWNQT